MTVEVVRVLVYTYADEEEMRADMGHWNMAAEGVREVREKVTIESMIVEQPRSKRTPRQQRVLDIANNMVRARNQTARGVPTAAVIEPEEEGRINVPGAIDTEVVDAPADQVEPMAMPPVKDPYRPATWLNPPAVPEGVLDIGDVFENDDGCPND